MAKKKQNLLRDYSPSDSNPPWLKSVPSRRAVDQEGYDNTSRVTSIQRDSAGHPMPRVIDVQVHNSNFVSHLSLTVSPSGQASSHISGKMSGYSGPLSGAQQARFTAGLPQMKSILAAAEESYKKRLDASKKEAEEAKRHEADAKEAARLDAIEAKEYPVEHAEKARRQAWDSISDAEDGDKIAGKNLYDAARKADDGFITTLKQKLEAANQGKSDADPVVKQQLEALSQAEQAKTAYWQEQDDYFKAASQKVRDKKTQQVDLDAREEKLDTLLEASNGAIDHLYQLTLNPPVDDTKPEAFKLGAAVDLKEQLLSQIPAAPEMNPLLMDHKVTAPNLPAPLPAAPNIPGPHPEHGPLNTAPAAPVPSQPVPVTTEPAGKPAVTEQQMDALWLLIEALKPKMPAAAEKPPTEPAAPVETKAAPQQADPLATLKEKEQTAWADLQQARTGKEETVRPEFYTNYKNANNELVSAMSALYDKNKPGVDAEAQKRLEAIHPDLSKAAAASSYMIVSLRSGTPDPEKFDRAVGMAHQYLKDALTTITTADPEGKLLTPEKPAQPEQKPAEQAQPVPLTPVEKPAPEAPPAPAQPAEATAAKTPTIPTQKIDNFKPGSARLSYPALKNIHAAAEKIAAEFKKEHAEHPDTKLEVEAVGLTDTKKFTKAGLRKLEKATHHKHLDESSAEQIVGERRAEGAGKKLMAALKEYGVSEADVHLTQAVKKDQESPGVDVNVTIKSAERKPSPAPTAGP